MAEERDAESSWFEYRRLVLAELKRIGDQVSELRDHVDQKYDGQLRDLAAFRENVNNAMSKLNTRMSVIEAKSAVYGTIAAVIVTGLIKLIPWR